ncbi:cell surface protein [Lactobacillus sp. LC28-10]|uniref:Cell surface protein n=2 Tax=Secundilactobacillus angelensis TaxID=2722706 RepID=A0ABX1KTR0_9LACO|nr:cell surface protein [Secundilactobacillus angelensis]
MVGRPIIANSPDIKGNVAIMTGSTAFKTPVSADQYKDLENGLTMEAFFKYNQNAPLSGERDIFSNQQGGGVGIGVDNGKLTFFAHVDGTYRQPSTPLKTGKWIHAVGVFDKKGHAVKLYVNGKLIDQKPITNGDIKWAQGDKAHNLVIGGDSKSDGGVESFMNGRVRTARLYDHALSDSEVANLNNTAQSLVTKTSENVEQSFESRLVGPAEVVAGHAYDLNVHTKQNSTGDIDTVSYDVAYDADKFDYVDILNGQRSTVKKVKDGLLHFETNRDLSTADFKNYGQTRLANIKFKAKSLAPGQSTTAQFKIQNIKASMNGKPVSNVQMSSNTQSVNIHSQETNDYNGDGIIGAGDIALAPADKRAEVAKDAVIRPYKHVIVLTTDGGGNPWDPNGMYYAKDNNTDPQWTTNPAILKKRQNTYTMDLFNKRFAMSTTAEAVVPTISAQNYISMLHGLPWKDLPTDYQYTNASSGQYYFNDFGKATPQFPSVFKVLQAANPNQSAAAFSEWGNILNGITEPDATVDKNGSVAWKSFDDVANYIGTNDFNNTALTYMQSDQMDHQGHGNGWFNDAYWANYAKYDDLFKKVMDKLEATGHSHDTLVIANADHGGWKTDHGQNTEAPNTNIFIGLGGETIDSGRRLHGGSNADISSLILHALQVQQPKSMTGKVFDSSAFLAQTELAKKHRNVETVTLKSTPNQAQILLKTKAENQLRSADLRINLAGRTVDKIVTQKGTSILRQTVENGVLTLTLGFENQPKNGPLAHIKFNKASKSTTPVKIAEAMVGSDKGKEILVDLINKTAGQDDADASNNTGSDNGNHSDGNKPNQPGNSDGTQPGTGQGDTNSNSNSNHDNHQSTNSEDGNHSDVNKPDQSGNSNNTAPGTDKPDHGHSSLKTEVKGHKWYAMKKIGFYKNTTFAKRNRLNWFKTVKQQKWAQFSFLKRVNTKQGYRYKVKDINKKSATFNQVGYITGNKHYVTAAEYTTKPHQVKVINSHGINAYRDFNATHKSKHYRAKKVLKIKTISIRGNKVRLQLANGTFITADKHDVQAIK